MADTKVTFDVPIFWPTPRSVPADMIDYGQLPPPFDLHAGDMVKFKRTGDKGIVIRKYKKLTECQIGFENHEIDMFYYEIMWLGKSVRSAGAHMLHQLEKIDSLEDDA